MKTAHINYNNEIQTVASHSNGVREKSGRYAEKINAVNISELQGLIHDIGKLCDVFDKYINKKNNLKRGDIDHCYAGAKYICEFADTMGSDFYNVSRLVAHTIISHHGLHDWYDSEGFDYLKKRSSKNENYDEIKYNLNEVTNDTELRELLIKANEEYKQVREKINYLCKRTETNKTVSRAFYLGMFERLLQSILVDADRTDTAEFMTGKQTEKIYSESDLKKLWERMKKMLEKKLDKFSDRTDIISIQRRSISERCAEFSKNKVGICRLIVPTGGGKTLSSLRFAINSCIKHGMEKIIYVAPFMSILEQNSDEIRSIAGNENFIEHHSNALMDINDGEELTDYELRTEKWDMPVIATTMVQFLNALFSGKMQSVRRMHRLSYSVIIIDEVQSVPTKCISLFNLAMNFLSGVCGCTIVLCSATQPVFDKTEFPLLFDEKESMTGDYSKDFEVFKRTDIIPKIITYGMSFSETAEFCRNEYEKAGNLLVIVNTKQAAKSIYKIMNEMSYSHKPKIIHLSTNMCPEHRRSTIREMREHINEPIICITTQLIEAGVDISFRCVVRSLAGLDNIVQAAGRCNRHGENEILCPVYIVDINEENLDKLLEIRTAKHASRQIIDSGKYTDYANIDTLSEYYKVLFKLIENKLDYNIKDPYTTLIDLLSINSEFHSEYLNNDYSDANKYFAQAFKTAGDKFEVIDSGTIGILVPYNSDAEDMINKLDSELEHEKFVDIMRKSQKYMVNVYQGMYYQLIESSAIRQTMNGVLILNAENYDSEYGIRLDKSLMKFLDY